MDHQGSKKELRSFGFLVGAIFTVIGVWPMLFSGESPRLWAIGLGGSLILVGGVLPAALAPIHKGWMWVGDMLGWINTKIILTIVFYGLVTPMGLLFRLLGKDVMRQAAMQDSPTYRVIREPRPRGHMRHQF